jgi:glycosyltransferase involved in cell wall biosynthesis
VSAGRLRAGIARIGHPGRRATAATRLQPAGEDAVGAPIARPIVLVATGGLVYHPRHYHLLAAGLYRAGHRVIVTGRPHQGKAHPAGAVPVSLLPSVSHRARRFLSAPTVLRHVGSLNPALVQINSIDLLPWAVLARRILQVPVIYDANEDYASYMLIKEWLPRPLRRPLSRIVSVVEPWLAGRLDGVVVADPSTRARFAQHGPVVLVYNFPELAFGDEVAVQEPRFDITHHGSLPSYTLRNVIATAQELRSRGADPSWRLVVRSGTATQQQALRDTLADAGVGASFTLEYGLPFQEMPGVVASTRVGFIPLPDEQKFRHNIPRKLFEFMAVGRPVVASDLPPIRALVGDAGCCILVRPGDAAGYADALQSLLDDPAGAAEMGRRGRALFRERMYAEGELGPYVALCENLARTGLHRG